MTRANTKTLLRLALIIALVWFIYFLLLTPSSDREWREAFQYTSTTESLSDGTIRITNVRDWTYEKGIEKSKDWIPEMVLHPNDIKRVWFLLEPFPSWSAAGHTYLTFEFSDGTAVSFSVEARMEKDESYSAVQGLFKKYELAYTWGTERDFLTRRLIYLDHDLYMYPLSITKETAAGIFTALASETNDVIENPRFYNTLTANCTNILAEIINKKYADQLPYHISWNFPGSSDKYLLEQGFIKGEDDLSTLRASHNLVSIKEDIALLTDESHKGFSQRLRVYYPRAH